MAQSVSGKWGGRGVGGEAAPNHQRRGMQSGSFSVRTRAHCVTRTFFCAFGADLVCSAGDLPTKNFCIGAHWEVRCWLGCSSSSIPSNGEEGGREGGLGINIWAHLGARGGGSACEARQEGRRGGGGMDFRQFFFFGTATWGSGRVEQQQQEKEAIN